jgi:hypothetical protein
MQTSDTDLSTAEAIDEGLARFLAIVSLTVIALIHAVQAPDAFGDAGYLGALFVGVVTAGALLAVALTRTSDYRIWMAAGVFAASILVGYLLSRIVGLPGFTEDLREWSEPRGLAAMVFEGLLGALSAAVLVTRSRIGKRAERAVRSPRAPGSRSTVSRPA